jgi:hypothetical protein
MTATASGVSIGASEHRLFSQTAVGANCDAVRAYLSRLNPTELISSTFLPWEDVKIPKSGTPPKHDENIVGFTRVDEGEDEDQSPESHSTDRRGILHRHRRQGAEEGSEGQDDDSSIGGWRTGNAPFNPHGYADSVFDPEKASFGDLLDPFAPSARPSDNPFSSLLNTTPVAPLHQLFDNIRKEVQVAK